MDILGPHPKTKCGNQYILVITDRYYKKSREIWMSNTKEPHILFHLLDYCIVPYRVPILTLTDRGLRFVGKLFTKLSGLL